LTFCAGKGPGRKASRLKAGPSSLKLWRDNPAPSWQGRSERARISRSQTPAAKAAAKTFKRGGFKTGGRGENRERKKKTSVASVASCSKNPGVDFQPAATNRIKADPNQSTCRAGGAFGAFVLAVPSNSGNMDLVWRSRAVFFDIVQGKRAGERG